MRQLSFVILAMGAAGLYLAAAHGQLAPVADGDILTGIGVFPARDAGGPITYTRQQEVSFTVHIDAEGVRRYVRAGSPYWIYDRDFTRIVIAGVDLGQEGLWPLLPPGGKVAPGIAWDVPALQTRTLCGFVPARYKATAEKGPDLPITIDGTDLQVPTIRIVHESALRCTGGEPWLGTFEMLYSPDLHEMLQGTTINFEGTRSDPLLMRDPGRGFHVQSIRRAKTKTAP